jgi:hypothetical protein
MTTAYTPLLGLALPANGELSGSWGTVVNSYITTYLDSAVAGGLAVTLTGDVTLSKTTDASLGSTSSQYAILNVTPNASTWTITAPAASKFYIVNNLSATYTFVIKASGQTGVTIGTSEKCVVAYNGTDFVKIASTTPVPAGSNTYVQYNNNGVLAGSTNLTFDGSFLTAVSIKNTALTSGRVTYAGTAGLLSDNTNFTFNGSALTVPSLVSSALTSGRVTYAGASGVLSDSSSLLYDGNYLTVPSLKDTALTPGRVPYTTTSNVLTDNASLLYDGSILTVPSLKNSALTSGYVTYAGADGLLSNNSGFTFNGSAVTVPQLYNSGLTSGRVTYATTSGQLVDAASFTFNGTDVTMTGVSNAASFVPSSSTVPTNGMYLSAANTVSFATNTTRRLSFTSAGYTQPVAYADTVVALGNTGASQTITCTSGNVFTATLTGNCTFTLSAPIATGSSSFTLILTNDATASRTVAWSGGTFKFPNGSASLSRTTAANGVDVWVFFTPDGGTTWYGNISMKNMST